MFIKSNSWLVLKIRRIKSLIYLFLLGEHSFKSLSLEDLVKSFDNTINDCFSEEKIIEFEEESKTPQEDLIASSKYVIHFFPFLI